MKAFLLISREGCLLSPLLFSNMLGASSRVMNRQEGDINGEDVGVKLFLVRCGRGLKGAPGEDGAKSRENGIFIYLSITNGYLNCFQIYVIMT